MKPTLMFFAAFTAFAGLSMAGSLVPASLAPATITTSLTQCEVQDGGPCVDQPNTGYNGDLSGYSTETVGTGAFLSASGFSSPVLTSDIPTSPANAIVYGELEYLIEVVGASGPVSLGVNSVGSISIDTVGNSPNPSNDASLFSLVQLELLSDSSGDAVFNDEAEIDYDASPQNDGSCSTSNNSTVSGVATLGTITVGCGESRASGGFDDTNSYIIQANDLYAVAMLADLNIGTNNPGGLSDPSQPANGSVEGIATVDPIFTAPNGYTLEFSSGVGNSVSSSPEPATWMMCATGIGLLGMGVLRRRGRSVE